MVADNNKLFSDLQFRQVALDRAHAYATAVHADDLVVKAGNAALVLCH